MMKLMPGAVAVLLGVIAPVLLVVSAQSTQLTVPVGFLLAAGGLAAAGRGRDLAPEAAATLAAAPWLALGAMLAWMLASAAWAPRPLYSLGVAGQIALIFAATVVGWVAVPNVVPARAGLALAAGLAVTAALALAEFRLGTPIRAWLGGKAEAARLNHAIIALVLLSWPAALALAARGWRWAAAALCAVAALAALMSLAQASVLGILAGAAGFALVWLLGAAGVWLATSLMVALVAATPMLMARIGDLIPEAAHGLIKASGWERVHIWHRFAEAVADRWLTGYGLQASRHMAEVRPIELLPSETFNPLGVGHTHNAVLQVWVELGAVGATLLAVILALVGRQIASLPAASRPFALATFASVFAIGYVSHGAWQIWWLAAIALAAVWMRAAIAEGDQAGASPPAR